jgi:hypothetical protein
LQIASAVDLDQPIDALNDALAPLEEALVEAFEAPTEPLLFIVGAPRSGTTLLTQLLITEYQIGYVSNLVARFWKAPYLGLLLAKEIRDADRPPDVGFSSDRGFTSGYEGPHEFGYFWRRWFDYQESHSVRGEAIYAETVEALRKECAAMQSVEEVPFLFKNLVCSFQVDFLARTFPQSVFLHCRRNPLYVAQSLLRCREQYCGSRKAWFSVKPEAYPELKELPYPDQIAGQIYYTRRHVEDAFQRLSDDRYCQVDYEAIVDAPAPSLQHVAEVVEQAGGTLERRKEISLPSLTSANERTVSPDEFERLKSSCRQLFEANQFV